MVHIFLNCQKSVHFLMEAGYVTLHGVIPSTKLLSFVKLPYPILNPYCIAVKSCLWCSWNIMWNWRIQMFCYILQRNSSYRILSCM